MSHDLFRYIKNQLTPEGTANVNRLAFSNGAAFYENAFVFKCIDELESAAQIALVGVEPMSACQKLVMELLLDSAYIEKKNINESVAHFLEWEKKREPVI